MFYADSFYKYRADKGMTTFLLPHINWFDKILWKIKGYRITELPSRPTINSNEQKEECLANCFCGGTAELTGGTYGYPTYEVRCLRCGGQWSMDTYSQKEAIERWNAKHK